MAREALSVRPVPDADGRTPDPRTREGMPDLPPTPTCWPNASGAARGMT